MNKLVPHLVDDYEKTKSAHSDLNRRGVHHIEELACQWYWLGSLYDSANIGLLHHVTQALRAHALFAKEPITVKEGRLLIDEFTGRAMMADVSQMHTQSLSKRRFAIQSENQTLPLHIRIISVFMKSSLV